MSKKAAAIDDMMHIVHGRAAPGDKERSSAPAGKPIDIFQFTK